MLDRYAQVAIRPAINAMAAVLHRSGISANALTWLGWAVGMASAVAIAHQRYTLGLVLVVLSRLLDGLDGAVARLGAPSNAGGFLDITLDFWFYAAIPLAFAWAEPAQNALASACLLAAFIGSGTSFLAYAVMQEKRQANSAPAPAPTPSNGPVLKSFYFVGGLTEATETLAFFIAMCLWPALFPTLAFVFAGLCLLTSAMRIRSGLQEL